jgi:DNA-binding HxlR family transcriptional regulator
MYSCIMRRTSFEDMDCSIAQTLEIVGDWWTLLIVRDLMPGLRDLHRFDDLQADLGIARNILTDRLDALIAHGVVEKRQYQDNPVRCAYHLTRKGRALSPVLLAMSEWGDEWARREEGPPVAVRHRGCGTGVHLQPWCPRCGKVHWRDVEVRGTRRPPM